MNIMFDMNSMVETLLGRGRWNEQWWLPEASLQKMRRYVLGGVEGVEESSVVSGALKIEFAAVFSVVLLRGCFVYLYVSVHAIRLIDTFLKKLTTLISLPSFHCDKLRERKHGEE